MTTAHARLSASGSERWLNCTSSPALCAGLSGRPSKWADEGTHAHSVAEAGAKGEAVAEEDNGVAKWVKPYVDHVRDLMARTPIHAIEKRVSLAPLWERHGETPPEPLFGTADFTALAPDGVYHVVDLKYGAGVVVEPQDNTQLLYYALGAVLALPESVKIPGAVRMTIVQPRAAHPDGPVRSHEIPTVDLLDWGYSILKPTVEKIARNDKDELSVVEGKWCRWCPAATVSCPQKRKTKTAAAQDDFDVVAGDEP